MAVSGSASASKCRGCQCDTRLDLLLDCVWPSDHSWTKIYALFSIFIILFALLSHLDAGASLTSLSDGLKHLIVAFGILSASLIIFHQFFGLPPKPFHCAWRPFDHWEFALCFNSPSDGSFGVDRGSGRISAHHHNFGRYGWELLWLSAVNNPGNQRLDSSDFEFERLTLYYWVF